MSPIGYAKRFCWVSSIPVSISARRNSPTDSTSAEGRSATRLCCWSAKDWCGRCGTVAVTVVDLTRNDLNEIYTLRSALEPLATTLAIERATPSDLGEIEQALADMVAAISGNRKVTERDAADLDVSFHDAIYRAAHHERLYAAWSQIRLPTYWFLLSRNVASPDWRQSMVAGHTAILKSIRSGDETAATTAIKEHISFAYERILHSYLGLRTDASATEPAGSPPTQRLWR